MIAISLACRPDILIADEPTTALDVTVQAQVLELMDELKRERGTGIVLITHDMGVVARMCDRVLVMKTGQVVESGDCDKVLVSPDHPYSQGLLDAMPALQLLCAPHANSYKRFQRGSYAPVAPCWGSLLRTALAGALAVTSTELTLRFLPRHVSQQQ